MSAFKLYESGGLLTCPKCRTENNEFALFCSNCGEFLNPDYSAYEASEQQKDLPLSNDSEDNLPSISDMLDADINEFIEAIERKEKAEKENKQPSPAKKKVKLVKLDREEDEIIQRTENIDEDNDFEHVGHRLKVFMVVACIIALVVGVGIGTFTLLSSDTSDNKATLEKYVLIIEQAQGYEDKGDYALALSSYKSAVELNPSLSAAYYGLSRVYTKLGDEKSAKEILEQGYINTGDTLLL